MTEAILEDTRGSLDQVRRLLLTLSSMDQFVQGDNQVLKFGKGGRGSGDMQVGGHMTY